MARLRRCLDIYALVEIYLGNEKFKKYLDSDFVITDITLAEFYGVLLRQEDEGVADYWFKKLEMYSFPVNKDILKEAIGFRHKHKKWRISFFDAVGYVFSLRNGFVFVTGDKEFEGMKKVDFKKK